MVNLVWFRQDLRLADNPALSAAVSAGNVIPLYILDDSNSGDWAMGAASRWWLHHSLTALNESLGGRLQVLRGDPLSLVPELVQRWGIDAVYWNRCYEPWQIQRDKHLKSALQERCAVNSFNGSLLWEPWQVTKQDGDPYRVFTPYYRKGCLQAAAPALPAPRLDKIPFANVASSEDSIAALQLLPTINWDKGFYAIWQPGEEGAAERLQHFIHHALKRYRGGRDVPEARATSQLSPHLHFGEVSPRQVWYAAIHAADGNPDDDNLDCFLSELGWREFSYYLLYHWPSLPEKNFQPKFDRFPWREDKALIEAWQRGMTGIPIVDAGMRELWTTGTMHNRVRMIVASFLVKNLRQHWHHGARWFWDCLLDADLASNSASWQWVAGSGADAAPYFRIFNPQTQGKKFDPDGHYVKRFCPELEGLPARYVHSPWEAPTDVLLQAGITLGASYPQPLVDLKISRQQALDDFASLKTGTD